MGEDIYRAVIMASENLSDSYRASYSIRLFFGGAEHSKFSGALCEIVAHTLPYHPQIALLKDVEGDTFIRKDDARQCKDRDIVWLHSEVAVVGMSWYTVAICSNLRQAALLGCSYLPQSGQKRTLQRVLK